MRNRTTLETVIICVAAVAIVGILSGTAHEQSSKALVMIALLGVLGLGITLGFRYLTVKKRAQLELTGDQHYRGLAEEYRRLTDLAITAQEHTDLKLGEVNVQLDYLRTQNESLQKILRDVE
jgi:uncharacterized protein HemX